MIYTFGGMTYSRHKIKHAMKFSRFLNISKNRNVLMVDGSNSSFVTMYLASRQMSDLKIVTMNEDEILEKLPSVSKDFDDVVINSAVGPHLDASLKISDRLVVPFSPADLSLWNMWKLTNIERQIDAALDENPKLKSHSFIVKADKQYDDLDAFINRLENSQYLEYMPSEEAINSNDLETYYE